MMVNYVGIHTFKMKVKCLPVVIHYVTLMQLHTGRKGTKRVSRSATGPPPHQKKSDWDSWCPA